MLLFLNTTQNNITIALRIPTSRGGFLIKQKKIAAKFRQAEKLLPAIDKLLRQYQAGVGDLRGIAAVTGPGSSFTSLRIGLAVANALGYGLDVPVVAVKSPDDLIKIKISKNERFRKIVLPIYDKNFSLNPLK